MVFEVALQGARAQYFAQKEVVAHLAAAEQAAAEARDQDRRKIGAMRDSALGNAQYLVSHLGIARTATLCAVHSDTTAVISHRRGSYSLFVQFKPHCCVAHVE